MSLKINKTVGDISKVAFSLLLGGLILFWMYHDFKFSDIADVLRHDMTWTWMLLSFPFGILPRCSAAGDGACHWSLLESILATLQA